ncbi:hypothetical protein R3W88_016182 [Solanum pinnatisectum]|uniref:Cytochrome c assembly protein domain-containing protein n=1 Tax=Solanum pinnatisectum TaxID=50273 RepID=A0AAV9KZ30_9SOLN|nr:hypothetical protein R3W88_016182 [Solanum pinnatisectum]
MVQKYDDIGLCGSLLSVALLVITFRKNKKFFFYKSNGFLNESFFLGEHVVENTSIFCAKNYYSYLVISLGFTFLTIGILSGAVWAIEAWGSYRNWDPKETREFITWIVFVIYLHTRTNRNLRGPAIFPTTIWSCILQLVIIFHTYIHTHLV